MKLEFYGCDIAKHNFQQPQYIQRKMGQIPRTVVIVSFVCVNCGWEIEMRGSDSPAEKKLRGRLNE
ncbi:MAG: hypothetical protein CXT67_00175 [Methanobacteriota archaeon]|nr:MAG: hypothetical protein CXT67_00175 [Euryarchaeota archaeon]